MIRKIIVPSDNTYVLNLPDSYVGKHLEVIAFELDEKEIAVKTGTGTAIDKVLTFYDTIRIDLSDYKFNRDEANQR